MKEAVDILTSRIFYDIYEIFLEEDTVLEDARRGWWVSVSIWIIPSLFVIEGFLKLIGLGRFNDRILE